VGPGLKGTPREKRKADPWRAQQGTAQQDSELPMGCGRNLGGLSSKSPTPKGQLHTQPEFPRDISHPMGPDQNLNIHLPAVPSRVTILHQYLRLDPRPVPGSLPLLSSRSTFDWRDDIPRVPVVYLLTTRLRSPAQGRHEL
jgi:hypothetical protein